MIFSRTVEKNGDIDKRVFRTFRYFFLIVYFEYMRIALCGAHGVGKTTLAKMLSAHFDLPVLEDIVVTAHHLGFEINEGTPLETQLWLTGKQLEQEKINQKFIADKCIFDYYVYADALDMDPELVVVAKKAALNTHNYDHIFYIAPEFPLVDDGLRSMNQDFQSGVDRVYLSFLDNHAIPYLQITGSVEDRFQQILNHIA